MSKIMKIKNIIFDLGGVFLNLDFKRLSQAFHALGALSLDTVYNHDAQDPIFDAFEIGKISSNIFRYELQRKLQFSVTDTLFDEAWNSILLDMPSERLAFVTQLKSDGYRVFLFSNTNEIHLTKLLMEMSQRELSFNQFFEKAYFSCRLGQRKPHVDAFQKILSENALVAEETLFIDDTIVHVEGAKKAKLKALHLPPEKTLHELLQEQSLLRE